MRPPDSIALALFDVRRFSSIFVDFSELIQTETRTNGWKDARIDGKTNIASYRAAVRV
jgi:hypothetical protein